LIAETKYQAVTANRVQDGVPVYLTRDGEWSSRIGDAELLEDCADALVKAQADPLRAIGPYAIDVAVAEGEVRPVGLRETIRAYGPTA